MSHDLDSAYLTNKPVLLSSLGDRLNQMYYHVGNSETQLIECTFSCPNRITLSSNNFNATSSIQIPIDAFVGVCVLHLQLPAVQVNETLCRGWGYRCLRSIGWQLGASSSSTVYLQGPESILHTVMTQCTSAEKRSQLLRLGGEEQIAPPLAEIGYPLPKNDAYVVIPLPFSTACDKLPFDTTLLSNNIVLQIQIDDPSAIYGGSATHPTQFDLIELIPRFGKMSDQSQSLRGELISRPDLILPYPYVLPTAFNSAPFDGVREGSGQTCQVQLNTFNNADLLGIYFSVVQQTALFPTDGSSPQPWNYDDISNITLTLNGSNLFSWPAKSHKAFGCLVGDQQGSYFQNSNIRAGNTAPFISDPQDSYMVYFDFSRIRSACIHDELQNVFKLPNQVLNLSFNTTRDDVKYILYATYLYNSVALIQSGVSTIRIA